jgi:hypothetical protein
MGAGMSFFSRLFRRSPPKREDIRVEDWLAMEVIAELERHGVTVERYDPREHDLAIGNLKVSLHNVFREWRACAEQERRNVVQRFVGFLLESIEHARDDGPTTFDAIADNLMPLLRTRQDIACGLLRDRIKGAPDRSAASVAWGPFIGDFVVFLGIDSPSAISRLQKATLEEFGIAFEEAMGRALKNLRARKLPPPDFAQVNGAAPGVYEARSWEAYQSSLVFVPERLPVFPDGEGDHVVLIPGRNRVIITGSNNEAGLLSLMDIAEHSIGCEPHVVSTTLLRHDGERWSVFYPQAGSAVEERHHRLVIKQDASDYAEQKRLLDKLHESRNEDIYVDAPLIVTQNGRDRSIASWGSAVTAALLPRSDAIYFAEQSIDPETGLATGTKRTMEVAWDRAFPLAGHLMEEVPDLYPPRYFVRSFPDEETLVELQKVATRT